MAAPTASVTSNRRGRETRERIRRAAEACFAEHGLAMTLDQVATAAGTTRMTVHRHTGGREALMTDLLLRASLRLGADVALAFERPGSFADRLVEALVTTIMGIRRTPHLARLFTGGDLEAALPDVDPDERVIREIHRFYGRYFEEARVQGLLRNPVAETTEWVLQQVLVHLVLPDSVPTEERLRRQLTRFLLPGVLAPPEEG